MSAGTVPRWGLSLYGAGCTRGRTPPSGGVSRPPLAVIAPHWTQFDGVTSTPPSSALVDLRRAHPVPEHGELLRNAGLDAEVVRRVVAGPVPGEIDARELVERELPVGRGIALRAIGAEERLIGVALGPHVPGGKAPRWRVIAVASAPPT